MGLSKEKLIIGVGAALLLAGCNQPRPTLAPRDLCSTAELARTDQPANPLIDIKDTATGSAISLRLDPSNPGTGEILRIFTPSQIKESIQAEYTPISFNAAVLIERQRQGNQLTFQARIAAVDVVELQRRDKETQQLGAKGPLIEDIKRCPTLMATLEDKVDQVKPDQHNTMTLSWRDWRWTRWQFNNHSKELPKA